MFTRRSALICAAILLFTLPAAAAGEESRCKQSSLAGTWWSLWDFGTGKARCAMECQLRIDNEGNVRPTGQCTMFQSGSTTSIRLRTAGGNLKMLPANQSWYCDVRGTVEIGDLSFDVRAMMSHDWGPKGRPVKGKSGGLEPHPAARQWNGITVSNTGAVGTVQNIWRSPTKGKLPLE